MLDVSPLTAVELFQSHLTGTPSKEFKQVCYDAAGDLYDNHIVPDFNKWLSKYDTVDFANAQKSSDGINKLSDESLQENAKAIRPWVLKNEAHKSGRSSVTGIARDRWGGISPGQALVNPNMLGLKITSFHRTSHRIPFHAYHAIHGRF